MAAAVNFPSGISKAALNAPDLIDLCPTPPPSGPLPIPYPNIAHHFAGVPATPVMHALFGRTDIDVLGRAPPTDFFIV
jgi:hypothetical protein